MFRHVVLFNWTEDATERRSMRSRVSCASFPR